MLIASDRFKKVREESPSDVQIGENSFDKFLLLIKDRLRSECGDPFAVRSKNGLGAPRTIIIHHQS